MFNPTFLSLALAISSASALSTHIDHNDIFVTNSLYGANYGINEMHELLHKVYQSCDTNRCPPTVEECDDLFCLKLDGSITNPDKAADVWTSTSKVLEKVADFKDYDHSFTLPGGGGGGGSQPATDVKVPQYFTVHVKGDDGSDAYNVGVTISHKEEQSTCEILTTLFGAVAGLADGGSLFGPITLACNAK